MSVDEALRDSAQLWRDVAISAIDPEGCRVTAAVLEDLRAALADLSIDGYSDLRIVGGTERLQRLLAPREGRTEP